SVLPNCFDHIPFFIGECFKGLLGHGFSLLFGKGAEPLRKNPTQRRLCLLRPRRQWPRGRSAAEQRDELAPFFSKLMSAPNFRPKRDYFSFWSRMMYWAGVFHLHLS